jgi:D-alanyl-D-alanine carboxypeptidase
MRERENLESYHSILITEQMQEEALKKQLEAAEKNYLLGKFDPAQMSNFVLIPKQYTTDGKIKYLRQETWKAFIEMATAATQDGVTLKIASGTRNFDYQKNLWDGKWEALEKTTSDSEKIFEEILEYSAVPGTSRHHWGTDVDINDADVPYFTTPKGEKVYNWLVKNAASFGFCQTYDLKGATRPTGYNEEKWHWSYVPLSKNFTEEYKNLITPADISGFEGDQYVKDFDLINDYVLDINPECL